jgi:hypothetical protein
MGRADVNHEAAFFTPVAGVNCSAQQWYPFVVAGHGGRFFFLGFFCRRAGLFSRSRIFVGQVTKICGAIRVEIDTMSIPRLWREELPFPMFAFAFSS